MALEDCESFICRQFNTLLVVANNINKPTCSMAVPVELTREAIIGETPSWIRTKKAVISKPIVNNKRINTLKSLDVGITQHCLVFIK